MLEPPVMVLKLDKEGGMSVTEIGVPVVIERSAGGVAMMEDVDEDGPLLMVALRALVVLLL